MRMVEEGIQQPLITIDRIGLLGTNAMEMDL